MSNKTLTAYAVMFKRKPTKTKKDGWERGMFVGRYEGDEKGKIIDMKMEIVDDFYLLSNHPHDGCIMIGDL